MSGTASPAPEPRRRGCALVGALVLLTAVGGGLWVAHAVERMRTPDPLPFQPVAYRPLERSLLTAKLELQQLPSKLFTGGSAELVLSERELNLLVFGDREPDPTGKSKKGRIVLEPGGLLRIEASQPAHGGGWVNMVARVRLTLGPGSEQLDLVDATVGEYTLGPVTRPVLQRLLRRSLEKARQDDPRLARLVGFAVDGDVVRLQVLPQ